MHVVMRERLSRAQQDAAYVTLAADERAEYLAAVAGMADLSRRFCEGEYDLEGLRQRFQTRTQSEWRVLGAGGVSGAMVLNKLNKHLADHPDDVASKLRAVVSLPQDDSAAKRQMDAFSGWLESLIETGDINRLDVQPGLIPHLVSLWWHAQAPDRWPPFYRDARSVLESAVGWKPTGDRATDYFSFVPLFREIAADLGVDLWDLCSLCSWKEGGAPVVDPAPPAPERERVWLVAPGPGASLWEEWLREGLMAVGWGDVGDLSGLRTLADVKRRLGEVYGYTNPVNAGLACFEFAHSIEVGDTVIAKRGRHAIIAWGKVLSEYTHVPARGDYCHVRRVEWTRVEEHTVPDKLVVKSLTDIGKYPAFVQRLTRLMWPDEIVNPDPEPDLYTLDMALGDLFLPREELQEMVELLSQRKNLVLKGPPGVGKTYIASRLAYLLTGQRSPDCITRVQFHQSYSYEDFVQGYRPGEAGGFVLKSGPFLAVCEQALQDQSTPYVLLIDEINRGNLSRILGELMLLIEHDKRDPEWGVQLAYSTDDDALAFHVPPNLHIIGTMNTADRSLALVDYALRRRFVFMDVDPSFQSEGFARYCSAVGIDHSVRDMIRARLKVLNHQIDADPGLGSGYCIGHSYFCPRPGTGPFDYAWYERVVRTEIRPLLSEYWFDDRDRVAQAIDELLSDA